MHILSLLGNSFDDNSNQESEFYQFFFLVWKFSQLLQKKNGSENVFVSKAARIQWLKLKNKNIFLHKVVLNILKRLLKRTLR